MIRKLAHTLAVTLMGLTLTVCATDTTLPDGTITPDGTLGCCKR
jgi:hypothetical protein